MSERVHGTQEVGDRFGVTPRTVRKWRKLGCPHGREGRAYRFDLEEVAEWRRGHLGRTEVVPECLDSSGKSADQRWREARARKEAATADLREIQAAKESGDLVDREEAQAAYIDRIYAVKGAFLGLADRYASRWAGITDARELHEEIQSAIRDILGELARPRDLYDPDDVAQSVEEAGGVVPFLRTNLHPEGSQNAQR